MKDQVREGFQDYMNRIRSAAMRHCFPGGLYADAEGCKRFARECGAAIPDFTKDEREINDLISASYSGICVIAYALRPPVDAKTWFDAMREGVRKALDIDRRKV